MKTIGERLKYLRGEASQAVFSKRLGVPQSTLSNYESGRNKPDFDLIDRICCSFGVSVEWLMFGRGSMQKATTHCTQIRPEKENLPTGMQSNSGASAGEEQAIQNILDIGCTAIACANCLELYNKLEKANERIFQAAERERELLKENSEMKTELALLKNTQSPSNTPPAIQSS